MTHFEAMNPQATRLLLVLHGHLPAVVGHGTWPHGSNWLYEAAAETYLPFLHDVDRLKALGAPVKATIGLTPVLCEQLTDARFAPGFLRYLAQRARAASLDRDHMAREKDPAADLAEGWFRFYRDLRERFLALPGRNIVAAFQRLADEGAIEPMACAATHGFLPLLPNDRAIERQLDVGLAAHARHFGRPARGIWIPECAYRPAGPWRPPTGGPETWRRGIEDFLAERGIEFFFVETHLVTGGEVVPAYGGRVMTDDLGRSPYRIHSIGTSSGRTLDVLARDPLSSQQVWSGIVGYPGDPRYLEFHKKRAGSGHRYWAVTDAKLPLDKKAPYEPTAVPQVLRSHATHFISLLEGLGQRPDGAPSVVVSMFDFELFGHWWFEGIDFIAEVLRQLSGNTEVVAMTVPEALATTPVAETHGMPAGTWGRGGDFQVWLNENTLAYWAHVESVERQLEAFERQARRNLVVRELLPYLERQALLLQSSDWPFLIDNAVSRDYAEKRIRRHLMDFEMLASMARDRRIDRDLLEDIWSRDRLFETELRYSGAWRARAKAAAE